MSQDNQVPQNEEGDAQPRRRLHIRQRVGSVANRTRGFVFRSGEKIVNGTRTAAHITHVLGYRAYERTFDNLHAAFPKQIRAPVGELLVEARKQFRIFRLREDQVDEEITGRANSTRIINTFLRSVGLRHIDYGTNEQGPWDLGADDIHRIVQESGESKSFHLIEGKSSTTERCRRTNAPALWNCSSLCWGLPRLGKW